jgi:hypothetical protein
MSGRPSRNLNARGRPSTTPKKANGHQPGRVEKSDSDQRPRFPAAEHLIADRHMLVFQTSEYQELQRQERAHTFVEPKPLEKVEDKSMDLVHWWNKGKQDSSAMDGVEKNASLNGDTQNIMSGPNPFLNLPIRKKQASGAPKESALDKDKAVSAALNAEADRNPFVIPPRGSDDILKFDLASRLAAAAQKAARGEEAP